MARPFSSGLVFSGLVIAALLAAGGYYTYRAQVMQAETNKLKPASLATSTVLEKIVTTTPKIACALVEKSLKSTGKKQTFEITQLAPVELNVHPGFITNDSGWLVFKHFNGGGPSYEVEDEKALRFAGQGPWYTTEILMPKSNNVSVVPTFNLPPETEQLLAGGPNSGTSGIGVGDNWFILVNETGGLGGPITLKQTFIQIQKNERDAVEQIAVPSEYGIKNDNPNALTEIMGRYNNVIVFGLNQATSTYAGFDYKTRKWQKLVDGDAALKGLVRKNRPDFKVADLIKEHGCITQDTDNGFLVFVPHFLQTQVIDASPTLDIYWYDDNDLNEFNWDRLKQK